MGYEVKIFMAIFHKLYPQNYGTNGSLQGTQVYTPAVICTLHRMTQWMVHPRIVNTNVWYYWEDTLLSWSYNSPY